MDERDRSDRQRRDRGADVVPLPVRAREPGVDPLALEPEAMRELGYRVVDLVVDRLARLGERPAVQGASRAEMERRLRQPSPERGEDFEQILAQLEQDVLPFASASDHPRFFAYVPSCPTWPGVLGDLIASGFNVYQGSWVESAGPSELELIVLDWFKEWVGYPEGASGLLLSGGSAANLTAMACAAQHRLGVERRGDAVVYVSSHTHSSVVRGARALGFGAEQIRVLPVDSRYRIRLGALDRAVSADRRAGRVPFLLVANAGTTNSGAIDPLAELAAICADEEIWLHADAAYGGFAVLTERGRKLLRGLSLADSVTLDPHKWLYQPYESGCLLMRDGKLLRQAFHMLPDYLRDSDVGETRGEVNFSDLGLQLTRASRSLKLWLSLKYFGIDAFRAAIDRSLDLARRAQLRIETSPELELVSPAVLGVVCFRRRPEGVRDEAELEELNAALVAGLAESGRGMISSTRLDGRFVLRLCVLNHNSSSADVDEVLDYLEASSLGELRTLADVVGHALEAGEGSEAYRFARYRRDPELLEETPLPDAEGDDFGVTLI
jgi:glutamate/tyrosine decarboxylase-like PLP-dependent enzyme